MLAEPILSLNRCLRQLSLVIITALLVNSLTSERLRAQSHAQDLLRFPATLPEPQTPPLLTSAKDLLQPPTPTPEALLREVPGTIDQFEVVDSTVFSLNPEPLIAQAISPAQIPPNRGGAIQRPSPTSPEPFPTTPTEPQTPPPLLPPPENLIPPPPATAPTPPVPEAVPSQVPGNIRVERFEVVGNTVFNRQTLDKATAQFTKKLITFAELLQASAAITKLYTDIGYLTSGAFIPASQTFQTQGSVVRIQVVEGRLEDIRVSGTGRLNPKYVRSRLAIATSKPLNVNKLLEALRLLQLNPLIKNISAELTAGSRPGLSLLDVRIALANTFNAQLYLDNNRTPSVGSFQRQIQLSEANLLGLGDGLIFSYNNTDGSNDEDLSYILPVNPRNGTLRFSFSNRSSHVIEPPFDFLNIRGTSQDYELALRQPVIQTPTKEFALGLSATRRVSNIGFLEGVGARSDINFPEARSGRLGFPSPGAENGITRLSILRFFQEWTQRNSQEVIAARSQFSLGTGAFDATINRHAPDSRFFAWRGQAQWVRLLAPDTIFLVRADAQLADRALVPLEQFSLGGQETVRGYRQDLYLTDSGVSASAEVRFPILRVRQVGGVLQIAPFVDLGTVWNSSGRDDPAQSTLASIGIGLRWQMGNRLTARFDWGIPLVDVNPGERTLQEKGLYFSVGYNLFSF